MEDRRRRGLDRAALPARAGRPRPEPPVARSWCGRRFAEYGALRPPGGLGLLMAAPTILTHGTPEQIDRLVPPILDGSGRPGASCSASPAPAPTSPGSPPAPSATATAGSSPARRCGAARPWSPTTACCSPAPTSTCPSTRASRGSRSRSTSPASPSGPLREMTGEAVFNEVFLDDAVCRRRRPHRRRGQRLGGHPDHAALRAHRHRRRRRARRVPRARPEGRDARPPGRRRRARRAPPNAKLTVGYDDVVELARGAAAAPTTPCSARSSPGSTPTRRLGQWNAQRGKAEAAAGRRPGASPASASSPRPGS